MLLGLAATPYVGCGPDHKPDQPCDGPTFNLVVTAESGPLPADTRVNVRYGSNQEGEAYALGEVRTPQAVFCSEDTSAGGAPATAASEEASGAASGAAPTEPEPATNGVQALRCRLYTQGPARLDVTAAGYEPIDDQALSLDRKKRCEIEIAVELKLQKPDAGK